MKFFSVDKRNGQYTVLINTNNSKTVEVETAKLPPFLNSGDIIKKIGSNYEFDFKKTRELKEVL